MSLLPGARTTFQQRVSNIVALMLPAIGKKLDYHILCWPDAALTKQREE